MKVVEPQTSVDTPAASVDATLETSLSDEFTSILGQVQSLTPTSYWS